jgi:hypothetical protein
MPDIYYIEQADVENYLGSSLSDSNQKTFDLLLPLLQDTIDSYCNRSWNFTNPVVETYDGNIDTFYAKYPKITAINSVTVGGSAWALTDAYNYGTHVKLGAFPNTALLSNPYGLQAVVISYNSDAAQTPPKAIKAAFVEWMASKLQTAPQGGRDVTRVQTGSVSVSYADNKTNEMPDFVKMVLNRFRLPPVDRF